MNNITKHTRIIMRLDADWESASIRRAAILKTQGYTAIAVAENYSKAHQMILGMRSNELVENLLGQLSEDNKTLIKAEIAKIATDFQIGIESQ